jgi:hypothetical protein
LGVEVLGDSWICCHQIDEKPAPLREGSGYIVGGGKMSKSLGKGKTGTRAVDSLGEYNCGEGGDFLS